MVEGLGNAKRTRKCEPNTAYRPTNESTVEEREHFWVRVRPMELWDSSWRKGIHVCDRN